MGIACGANVISSPFSQLDWQLGLKRNDVAGIIPLGGKYINVAPTRFGKSTAQRKR